jgi:ribosomal protein L37E
MKPPTNIQGPPPDFSQSTGINCDRCGNATYQEVCMMRHFSAIASPNGKEGVVPVTTFACVACGWVNNRFLPPVLQQQAPNTDGSTPTPSEPTPKKSLITLVN